jgi:predicted TIM-barrel fold metal-dependent hydrolase
MERLREQEPPTRRDIVALAAAGAGALAAGKLAWAQPARSPGRIDLHHHYFPPAFLQAQRDAAVRQNRPAALGAALESWSKARTIEAMDRYGISIGILSISTPGPWFGNIEQSKRLARECNEYAAEMMRDHAGRFGLFAALPLPDPDAALCEIDYAFDTLHADGVAIMTSYGTSAGTTWPGDASLAPVFAELNRRKAAAFFHLGRVGSSQLCRGNVVSGVPDVMAETPHEMTRAIMSLLFSGTLSRNPDIRFIFTNAGGTVPMLSGRIAAATKRLGAEFDRLVPKGAEYELKKLIYEVSNATSPTSLAAVAALVSPSQIVFGTDYPFVPIETTIAGIDAFWADALRDPVYRANAATLLPRLA